MSKELIDMVDTLIAHVNGAHTSTSASWADANWQAADRVLEKVQSRIKEDEAKFLQTHNWLCDRNETIAEQTLEITKWKEACRKEYLSSLEWAGKHQIATEQIEMLRESLIDTLDFLERHSNRWDGVNGKHPFDVVESARAALNNQNKS